MPEKVLKKSELLALTTEELEAALQNVREAVQKRRDEIAAAAAEITTLEETLMQSYHESSQTQDMARISVERIQPDVSRVKQLEKELEISKKQLEAYELNLPSAYRAIIEKEQKLAEASRLRDELIRSEAAKQELIRLKIEETKEKLRTKCLEKEAASDQLEQGTAFAEAIERAFCLTTSLPQKSNAWKKSTET
eukprot:Colp12_sorted_trinity150504_noHs@19694